MFDWGMMHGWINISLALFTGVVILAYRPWPRSAWFCGALFWQAVSSALYLSLPLFHVEIFWNYNQDIFGLLLIGAVWELQDHPSRPMMTWLFASFIAVAVSALIVPFAGPYYFLPRAVFYIGLALLTGRALRERSLPLFSLAFLALGKLASGGIVTLLLVFPYAVIEIQDAVELWWSTTFYSLLSVAILAPHAYAFVRRLLALAPAGREAVAVAHSAAGADNRDDIERFLQSATAAISLENRDYLTLEQAAFFLSIPTELAIIFIEKNNIRKFFPPGADRGWLVRKADIKQALRDNGIEFEEDE